MVEFATGPVTAEVLLEMVHGATQAAEAAIAERKS